MLLVPLHIASQHILLGCSRFLRLLKRRARLAGSVVDRGDATVGAEGTLCLCSRISIACVSLSVDLCLGPLMHVRSSTLSGGVRRTDKWLLPQGAQRRPKLKVRSIGALEGSAPGGPCEDCYTATERGCSSGLPLGVWAASGRLGCLWAALG